MRAKLLSWIKLNSHLLGVIGISIVVYLIQDAANPISRGRDFGTYELYFRDFFVGRPEFPVLMLFRTPIVPLIFGCLFNCGNWIFLHGYFLLSYLLVCVCAFRLASHWGKWPGWISVVIIWISIEFFHFFNSVASENPTGWAVMLWFVCAFLIRKTHRILPWVILALITFALVLVRPNHQVLAVAGLLVFLARDKQWSRKLLQLVAFGAVFMTCILSYSFFNQVRYGVFEVSHLGPSHMPFYRIFIHTKMIRPENGEASQQLAEIVRQDVLTRDVFKTYGIDETTFWEMSTPRFWIHIVDALNHRYGYEDNNKILSDVSIEAHNKYPLVFWLSYVDDLRKLFEFPERARLRPKSQVFVNFSKELAKHEAWVTASGKPFPGEDDFISGGLSQLTFQPAEYQYDKRRDFEPWKVRDPDPVYLLTRITYLVGYLRPSISVFLTFIFIALWVTRCRNAEFNYLVLLICIIVAMLCATAMANPEPQFRYPFDTILIIGGLVGIKMILDKLTRGSGSVQSNRFS